MTNLVVDEEAEQLFRQLVVARLQYGGLFLTSVGYEKCRNIAKRIKTHLQKKYGSEDFRVQHISKFLTSTHTGVTIDDVQYIIHAEARGFTNLEGSDFGIPKSHNTHEQWLFFLKQKYEEHKE